MPSMFSPANITRAAPRAALISCLVSSLAFVSACGSGSDDDEVFQTPVDTSAMDVVPVDPEQAEMFQQVSPQSIGNTSLEAVSALDGLLIPTIFATETDVDPAFAQSSVALVEQLNESLLLPVDVAVSFADCGTANAFFAPAFDGNPAEIFMCHELTLLLAQFYGDNEQAFLASTFVLMHEIGHALIDVLDLPVLGIEESYVDGVAAVLLGESGMAEGSVLAGWFFGGQTNTPFFDTHRAGPQRLGDLACWGIGADPTLLDDPLTASIADQLIQTGRDCEAEYNQQLLGLNAVLGQNILGGLDILSIPSNSATQ